jgi:L-amino acid N-acyltransferase YncA
MTEQLEVVPITFRAANAYVGAVHRHHRPVIGCKFAVAVADVAGEIRGVAIAGRPVARALDDGRTLEVNRCATDGARNACSMLYRAAWRAARAMGYRRLVTYTLPEEGGASLRAAGFRLVGLTEGGGWNCNARPRADAHPLQRKHRWEIARA